jgi:hypothetical protein
VIQKDLEFLVYFEFKKDFKFVGYFEFKKDLNFLGYFEIKKDFHCFNIILVRMVLVKSFYVNSFKINYSLEIKNYYQHSLCLWSKMDRAVD